MHFFRQCVAVVGLLAAVEAIDGRPPCDPGVLLEKAGVNTLKSCLASANVTLEQLNQAHAAAICSTPTCVTVLTQASTTTNCPQGQEFGAICSNTTTNSTTKPTAVTTAPVTHTSTPATTATSSSPVTTAASTTETPSTKAPASSAKVNAITGVVIATSTLVALNY